MVCSKYTGSSNLKVWSFQLAKDHQFFAHQKLKNITQGHYFLYFAFVISYRTALIDTKHFVSLDLYIFVSMYVHPGKTILHLFARYMQEKQETCKINAILQEYSFARFVIKILARKYTISCRGSCILAR